MKKIPAGAEACNVLVGEADFLSRPMVAFVRLSPAVLLSGLAEVPITTRYVADSKYSRDHAGGNLEMLWSSIFYYRFSGGQDYSSP